MFFTRWQRLSYYTLIVAFLISTMSYYLSRGDGAVAWNGMLLLCFAAFERVSNWCTVSVSPYLKNQHRYSPLASMGMRAHSSNLWQEPCLFYSNIWCIFTCCWIFFSWRSCEIGWGRLCCKGASCQSSRKACAFLFRFLAPLMSMYGALYATELYPPLRRSYIRHCTARPLSRLSRR